MSDPRCSKISNGCEAIIRNNDLAHRRTISSERENVATNVWDHMRVPRFRGRSNGSRMLELPQVGSVGTYTGVVRRASHRGEGSRTCSEEPLLPSYFF